MNATKPLYIREAIHAFEQVFRSTKHAGTPLAREATALSITLQTGASIPDTYKVKHPATLWPILCAYWDAHDERRHIDAQIAAMKVEIRERAAFRQAVLARVRGS